MTEISAAIKHTPLWVWPLIILVLVLGARNLRTRERSLPSLYILPVILLFFALANLVTHRAGLVLVIPAFVFSALVGIGIGWNLIPRQVEPIHGQGRVRVPGSVMPLLIVIAAVILRYLIGYTYGRWPELRGNPALALEFSSTGALLAGIVWGRILHLGWIYRHNG